MIEIKNIGSIQTWNQFIDTKKPKTFLHTWQWAQFNESLGSKTFKLGVFKESELIGVALLVKEVAKRGSFLLCPHGPIIDWQDTEVVNYLFTYIKKLAKEEKVSFVRICSLAKDDGAHKDIFKKYNFREAPIHVHPEISWMLDLEPSEEDLLKNMRKNCRYAIKKALKDGVTVESSSDEKDLAKFENIYGETADRNHFTPFSMKYIKKEFEIFNNENKTMMFFGKYQGEIISGSIINFCNGSGFYHHGASTRKFSKIATSQLVQWEAIKEAKRRGCKFYNFWGIAPENSPTHPFAGITRFKTGFGGFSEQYVHAQDLIINYKYWLNFAVETVRKIKRGF